MLTISSSFRFGFKKFHVHGRPDLPFYAFGLIWPSFGYFPNKGAGAFLVRATIGLAKDENYFLKDTETMKRLLKEERDKHARREDELEESLGGSVRRYQQQNQELHQENSELRRTLKSLIKLREEGDDSPFQ